MTSVERWNRNIFIALLGTFITVIALCGFAIWFAADLDAQSNRRWCGLIVTLDDAYKAAPLNTDTGRELARQIAALRSEFDC